MGRAERQRWRDNERATEIVQKPKEQITKEDIQFLKENYTSVGGLVPSEFSRGAFFTPTHVARFICKYLNIKDNSKVLEPSAGAGVFLEHIPQSCKTTAIEISPTSAKIAQLIYPHANVIQGNTLHNLKENYYDYVIGNPPFGEPIILDSNDDNYITLSKNKGQFKGKSESVFLEYAIKSVKYGGYIAFILPMGISYSQNHKKIRELIYNTCWHVATIELPSTTFQHVGTSIPTQIMVLRKVPKGIEMIQADKSLSDGTKFYKGQQPSLFARVGDIGFDKKGKSTDKWGDGLTQLDELLSLVGLGEDVLVRENLYPYKPWWVDRGQSVAEYCFSKSGASRELGSEGFSQESRYILKKDVETGLVYWHEMTLGVNYDDGSWDFSLQDRLVKEYNKSNK